MELVDSLTTSPKKWPAAPAPGETIERIERRARPERRLLGLLAAAARHGDAGLVDAVLTESLGWPEQSAAQSTRKAQLIYAMTALLARAGHTELALKVAPTIPFAPRMAQVLVFTAGDPRQCYCWRVTPAYALTHGRRVAALPVAELARPYDRGEVEIDDEYLRKVLLPRRRRPSPILLLPHPLGLVRLGDRSYIVLDGNHRVACAAQRRQLWLPGYILTPEEGAAVLISHSRWPPYASVRSTTGSQ